MESTETSHPVGNSNKKGWNPASDKSMECEKPVVKIDDLPVHTA